MKAPTLMAVARHRGTEFSNPFPSSGESANFQFLYSNSGAPHDRAVGHSSRRSKRSWADRNCRVFVGQTVKLHPSVALAARQCQHGAVSAVSRGRQGFASWVVSNRLRDLREQKLKLVAVDPVALHDEAGEGIVYQLGKRAPGDVHDISPA